jgi:hypothetical protein
VALQKAERLRSELCELRTRTSFTNVLSITDEVLVELTPGDLVAA